MLVLSVRQPWVYAIFHLGKDVENRDWAIKSVIGKTVAIHASAGMTKREFEEARDFILCEIGVETANSLPPYDTLERGCIIGTVQIVGLITKGWHPSKWYAGSMGFQIARPSLFKIPIPCKGKLGFWQMPKDIEVQVNREVLRRTI